MASVLVVPVEPPSQILGKLGSVFIGLQVDSLVFQGTPEPFDENIVLEPALAVHADLDVPDLEDGGKFLAGKLAPLVSVENVRGAVFEQSLFERLNAEAGIQCVGQPPGQDLPGGPVHDGNQVHEAPSHGDIGNIRCPNLIGSVNGQSSQQIGVDRVLRLPSTGTRLGCQRFDSHDQHETPDAIPPHRRFRGSEVVGQ